MYVPIQWTSYRFRTPETISEDQFRAAKHRPELFRGLVRRRLRESLQRELTAGGRGVFLVLGAIVVANMTSDQAARSKGLVQALYLLSVIVAAVVGMSLFLTFGSLGVYALRYLSHTERTITLAQSCDSFSSFCKQALTNGLYSPLHGS